MMKLSTTEHCDPAGQGLAGEALPDLSDGRGRKQRLSIQGALLDLLSTFLFG